MKRKIGLKRWTDEIWGMLQGIYMGWHGEVL